MNDFRLNPASDTGIVGDNVTNDRTPVFIGTTAPGNTVELFVNGQPAVQATATASSTTSTDSQNGGYNFSIQLPYALSNGQISLSVEVINPVGNTSAASNSLGLAIASTAADYNGGSVADPAEFARNTTSNQVPWLVQTPAGSAPPGSAPAAFSTPPRRPSPAC